MAAPVTLFRQTPEGEQSFTVDIDTAKQLSRQHPGQFSVDPNERIVVDLQGQETEMSVGDYFGQYGTGLDTPRTFGAEEYKARVERAQYGSVGQQVLAGAEGLASGVTLGISRPYMEGVLGDDYEEASRKRQEYNPLTAGTGEAVGMILPALLTGGTSTAASAGTRGAGTIARMARYTPAGASAFLGNVAEQKLAQQGVSKALQLAGAGATDGAVSMGVYGLAQDVREGEDLNKIATNALINSSGGALGGGIFGFGIGKVLDGVEGATRAIKPTKELSEFAQPFRNAVSETELSVLPKNVQEDFRLAYSDAGIQLGYKEAKELQETLQQKLISKEISDVDSGFEFIQNFKTKLDDYIATETKIAQQLQRQQKGIPKFTEEFRQEKFLKALGGDQATLRSLSKQGDEMQILRQTMRTIEDLKTADGKPIIGAFDGPGQILDNIQPIKDKIGSNIGKAIGEVPVSTNIREDVFSRGMRYFDEFDQMYKEAEDMGLIAAGVDTQGIKKAKQVVDSLKDKFQKELGIELTEGSSIDPVTGLILKGGVRVIDESKMTIQKLWEWRKEFDKYLRKPGIVDYLDPSKPALMEIRNGIEDIITDVASKYIDNNPSIQKSIGTSYANLKKQYRALRIAEDIAERGRQKSAGNSFFSLRDQLSGVTAGTAGAVGGLGREFVQASVSGGAPGGATVGLLGMATGADPSLYLTAAAASMIGKGISKIGREYGNPFLYRVLTDKGISKINVNARVLKAISPRAAATRISGAAGQYTSDKFFGNEIDTDKKYNDLNKNLDKKYAQLKSQLIAGQLPPLEQTAANQLMDALEYLQNERPVQPGQSNDPLQPKKNPTKPDPVSIRRYLDKVQVVDDPKVVLDHLNNNTLNTNHVQALRQNYPEFYKQIQQAIVQEIQSTNENSTPAKRYQIGLLLNEPKSYGLANLNSIQSSFNYEAQEDSALEGSGVAELPNKETVFSLA